MFCPSRDHLRVGLQWYATVPTRAAGRWSGWRGCCQDLRSVCLPIACRSACYDLARTCMRACKYGPDHSMHSCRRWVDKQTADPGSTPSIHSNVPPRELAPWHTIVGPHGGDPGWGRTCSMARNVDTSSVHTFSHQTCPSDHGIARLTPLSAVSLRVHHFQNHLRSHLYYMLRWGPRESTGIRNASAGTRGARIDCFGTGSQGRRLFVTGIPGRPPVAYEQPGIRRPPQSGRGSRKDPKTTGIQERSPGDPG